MTKRCLPKGSSEILGLSGLFSKELSAKCGSWVRMCTAKIPRSPSMKSEGKGRGLKEVA